MTALPDSIRERHRRHLARHEGAVGRFRTAVKEAFLDEAQRMGRRFAAGPLAAGAAPVAEALADYVGWFRWCAWCSTHLAPVLDVDGERDARRMAAALLVYCGPRLIDDAIDDHRSYKGLRETLLQRLVVAFPEVPPDTLRCEVGLLGTWVSLHGLRRLERWAGAGAARRTQRLCERVIPGPVLERLHAGALGWEGYRHLVRRKAVYYDQILYRNLVEPVPQPLRRRVLCTAARLSQLAQYLNDFGDRDDDRAQGQPGALEWLPAGDPFREACRAEAAAVEASLDALPPEVGDALAAALAETIDSAARLHAVREASGPTLPLQQGTPS